MQMVSLVWGPLRRASFYCPQFSTLLKEIHEMTVETILASGAAVAAVISTLFGGSLFKRYIDHVKELAVTQHMLQETRSQVESLVKDVDQLRLASTEDRVKIAQYTENIKKLDMLPHLIAQTEALKNIVESVQSTVTSIATHQRNK
jgi:hypothetical protein